MADSGPLVDQNVQRIATYLKERGETLAVSESSTGGLLSAALLAVPGASAYFLGGGVVYTLASRDALLNIELDKHPGVRSSSEPYALLCARAIRDRLGATWGLAETGAAGPSGNRYGDAAGHTCIAVVGPNGEHSETLETGSDDREANMWRFTRQALSVFHDAVQRQASSSD